MTRILLVEDDEALMRRLGWMLTEAHHDIRIVRSTDDVDGAIVANEPQVVIFNTEMAPGEKRTRIDRFHADHASLKVIDMHTHMARLPGETDADAYIHKPFEADDLLALVDEVANDPPGDASAPGAATDVVPAAQTGA